MSDAIATGLAPVQVLRPDGQAEALGGQWAVKPVVLVMLRHFG